MRMSKRQDTRSPAGILAGLLLSGAWLLPVTTVAEAQQQAAKAQSAPPAKAASKSGKAPVKRAAAKAAEPAKTATMTREEANRLVEAGQASQAAGRNDEAVKSLSQAIR